MDSLQPLFAADVMQRFQQGCQLQTQLEKALNTPVDLVILNDAKPILQHEAVLRGKLLFSADDTEAVIRFEARIRGRYEDYAFSQRFFTRARRARQATT